LAFDISSTLATSTRWMYRLWRLWRYRLLRDSASTLDIHFMSNQIFHHLVIVVQKKKTKSDGNTYKASSTFVTANISFDFDVLVMMMMMEMAR
jgi:hypothetical protein